MRYVVASIELAFFSFINLVIALTMHLWISNTFSVVRNAANSTNVYSNVNPILSSINTVFWLVFIFTAVGAIVLYGLKAHEEEYERYQE